LFKADEEGATGCTGLESEEAGASDEDLDGLV